MFETFRAATPNPTRINYPFKARSGGQLIFADTVTDLVAAILGEDYLTLSEESRAEVRERCVGVCVDSWAMSMPTRVFDGLSVQQQEVVVTRGDMCAEGVVWGVEEVPLVLSARKFEPYDSFARPVPVNSGRVILLDSSTEEGFLEGLVAFGVVEMLEG